MPLIPKGSFPEKMEEETGGITVWKTAVKNRYLFNVYVCFLHRSSPILLRFSKQLKMGLSDTCHEGFMPASASVDRLSGALSSRVSTSSVETCQGHLCLTDSLTQQQSSVSPLPSKLTPGPEMSHTWRLEKNIFASIRLTDVTSDHLTKTESRDEKMPSDSAENEVSAQSSECPVSSLFSVSEKILNSPSLSCGNGSTPIDDVVSDDVKDGNSEQRWSASGIEVQSSNGARLCTSGLESTLPSLEMEEVETSFCDDFIKKLSGVKPVDSVGVSGSDSDVTGIIHPTIVNTQQSGRPTPSNADGVAIVDSDADHYSTAATGEITLDKKEGMKDHVDDDDNSSIRIDPMSSGNRCDNIVQDSCIKNSASAASLSELSVLSCSVSVLHQGTSSISDSAVVNLVASRSITPVDIAEDDMEARTQLHGSDLPDSSPDKVFPSVSSDYTVQGSIETSKSFATGDSKGISKMSDCHSHVTDDEFTSHCQTPEEHCHRLQHFQSENCHTSQIASSVSFTDTLPMQSQSQLSVADSCAVPVSLFSTQSCTTSTPVPVALFCAHSCSSETLENRGVLSWDVRLDSSGAVLSHLSEVSVSVSDSQSEIPRLTMQHNPSQLPAKVREETEKAEGGDGSISKCAASDVAWSCQSVWSTSTDTPVSDVPLSLSKSTSTSVLPANNPELLQQCSVVSDVLGDSVLGLQLCPGPINNVPEIDSHIEEGKYVVNSDVLVSSYSERLPHMNEVEGDHLIKDHKDFAVTNSDDPSEHISDKSIIPFTNICKTDCHVEETKDFDKTSSVVHVSSYAVSDLQQLSDTNSVEGDHRIKEQKDIGVTNSDEPDECISDESIVSQILAAECSQSESLDCDFVSQSFVSNCPERQKWREMVSPIVSSKQSSQVLEDDSNELSAVTTGDGFVDDESVKDLVQSTELSTELNVLRQSTYISGALYEEDHNGGLALLPAVAPSNDGWTYDASELQDVLCALLNSCHMNSTDPDESLPLDDVDDDDDNNDAQSCSSSATEVYVDLPDDLKLDDVTRHCGSSEDKDSDGTVSLLSVVLDGDGLDLMDAASDGFQNIYSSLVGAPAMDPVLSSDANDLNSSTYCNNTSIANLSAFAVEHTSLLDKEGSSAVMALDAGLVRNLPRPTASVASLCDRLEESGQQPKKDDEDVLQTDVAEKPAKSFRCHCSKPHTSKKSCRSSLRMPEKLANVDPDSPLVACRPPPLSVRCGKYGTDTHCISDIVGISENTSPPSAGTTSAGLDNETPNQVPDRKQKRSGVSDAENESNTKHSSIVVETKSHKKRRLQMLSAARKTRRKHKKDNLKSFGDIDKIRVTPRNFSKNSAMENERYTFRISASQVKKPTGWTSSVVSGQMLSEERPTTRSRHTSGQVQQTMFTLEHTRTGSTRMVILRKPAVPPMLSTATPSGSKWKLDRATRRHQVNCDQKQGDILHRKKEKKPLHSPEKPRRRIAADDSDTEERRNKVGSEVENETDEEFSLKKMMLRSHRSSSVKQDRARSKNSKRLSQGNGNRASCKMSRDGTDQSSSDRESGGGRQKKRCLLLAQLENSEGYVADRNVLQQQQLDSSLLWSDTNTLSREERALQVGIGLKCSMLR